MHIAHVSVDHPWREKWTFSFTWNVLQWRSTQNVTEPLAEVLRSTLKEDAVSNVFVTVFVFESAPAEAYTVATRPFASEGRALVPVADMVPEQPTDPPAPEMGTPFSIQFQDTLPEALPLQSKLHDPDAWAVAGAMANVESARSARANTAEVVRRVRTPTNLLRIAVVPLPEPRKVDGASRRMKVGCPKVRTPEMRLPS